MLGDFLNNVKGSNGHTIKVEHRNQLSWIYLQFEDQQSTHLCVPVLFNDKYGFVGSNEFFHLLVKWKSFQPHGIYYHTLSVKAVHSFLCRVSRGSKEYDTDVTPVTFLIELWSGYQVFGSVPFDQYPFHVSLIGSTILRVFGIFVPRRSSRKERSQGGMGAR